MAIAIRVSVKVMPRLFFIVRSFVYCLFGSGASSRDACA